MNLFDMIKPVDTEEKVEKKETKPKTKAEPKEFNKIEKAKDETKASPTSTSDGKPYTFPFQMYLACEKRDVSHIFDEGTSYDAREINKRMLEHGFYEFAGSVTYDYIESENLLVPTFQQHKKG